MHKSLLFLVFICVLQLPGCTIATVKSADLAPIPSVLIFNMADMHSAYDAYPILLATIDSKTRASNGSRSIFVINGDFFEGGSIVAQKSKGKLDMALLAQLVKRGDVIFNIGNHDFDILPMNHFIQQATALGIKVIGTFASSQLAAPLPAYTDIQIEQHSLRFIGVDTDHVRTFPAAIRQGLTIPSPVEWLRDHYGVLAQGADYNVLLSHAGLLADKAMLAFLVPQPIQPLYMLGAHDHLNLQTEIDGIPYLHSAFKGLRMVITTVLLTQPEPQLTVETLVTDFAQAGLKSFAEQVATTRAKSLSAQDLVSVGTVPTAMTLNEAVDWTLHIMRDKTAADVALFNHSSFGSGLPQGPLALYRFNEFMRFENQLVVVSVDGKTLEQILSRANQHQSTQWANLSGDFVYANDISPKPDKHYKIVTTDWVSDPDNQANYIGRQLSFQPLANMSIKGILKEALREQ